jgi:hypothetical protein
MVPYGGIVKVYDKIDGSGWRRKVKERITITKKKMFNYKFNLLCLF